jgi:hypothetical protein
LFLFRHRGIVSAGSYVPSRAPSLDVVALPGMLCANP